MPDTPTPGQRAYEAWWIAFGDDPPLADAYAQLTPRAQHAWEAAAQAVLTAWQREQARLGAPGWLVAVPSPADPGALEATDAQTPAPRQGEDALQEDDDHA